MICTLIASSILLSMEDGSMAVLIPENQSVRIFNEQSVKGEGAVVHLYGETKIQVPGVKAEQIIEALRDCQPPKDAE
ncbi:MULTISPECIES: hypothetical protein [Stappiaceae]|jgi:hypothetical protein|nr:MULTISPECIES: hypothetical protein [Stappiaceae]MCR9284613.1 hypothetical protein [Paracoccaceae bacterium]MEC9417722.1 hypothetical protein [Pseudomonadota bacterium]AQQ05873.1 hypothetical protein B0E33_21770 [Roseibium aggregatum]ERP93773.1 hypothetical protein Q669_02665 [Labrenzia sp. C1B10]MBN8182033.1 hypothetical protein [Roseibium aggregatum]